MNFRNEIFPNDESLAMLVIIKSSETKQAISSIYVSKRGSKNDLPPRCVLHSLNSPRLHIHPPATSTKFYQAADLKICREVLKLRVLHS